MPARYLVGDSILDDLCRALGLDSPDITTLTFRVGVKDVVKIEVEQVVTDIQMGAVKVVLEQYDLVPRELAPKPDAPSEDA
jgi:hypothetical protein